MITDCHRANRRWASLTRGFIQAQLQPSMTLHPEAILDVGLMALLPGLDGYVYLEVVELTW
jgi:hypothetical protein